MKKRIPIGISDFKELIEADYYYVDKSLLISEFIESGAKVTLLPRPRRFGKTLNLSLLRYFFEKTEASNTHLFQNLKIESNPECMAHQGQYPVIFITLKDVQNSSYQACLKHIGKIVGEEYERHSYLLAGELLSEAQKRRYRRIMDFEESEELALQNSLHDLSKFLFRYHNKKSIILIDEYDSPIHTGYAKGFYDEIIDFFRGLLGVALKDNAYLERSVITGILRVSKESVFSGLNHIKVFSLLQEKFSTQFGLLESEVRDMLEYYELENEMETVSQWYNGYLFGGKTIYNPWSVLNYIEDRDSPPLLYWVNTSSNRLIQEIIINRVDELQEDLERLILGESVTYSINEETIFSEIENSSHSIWSFLLLTGYLKATNGRMQGNQRVFDLMIPNLEVREVFQKTILGWLEKAIGSRPLKRMLRNLLAGQVDDFVEDLQELVKRTLSSYDTRNDFVELAYHMFVLGLMVNLEDSYIVRSNEESGYGRFDMALEPKDKSKPGFLFEFKRFDPKKQKATDENLNKSLKEALNQIQEKAYLTNLQTREITPLYCIALVFDGKVIHHQWQRIPKEVSRK